MVFLATRENHHSDRYADEIIMKLKKSIAASVNGLSIAAVIAILNNAHWAAIGIAMLVVLPVFAISALAGLVLSIISWRKLKALHKSAWPDVALLVVYAIELLFVIVAFGFMVYAGVVNQAYAT